MTTDHAARAANDHHEEPAPPAETTAAATTPAEPATPSTEAETQLAVFLILEHLSQQSKFFDIASGIIAAISSKVKAPAFGAAIELLAKDEAIFVVGDVITVQLLGMKLLNELQAEVKRLELRHKDEVLRAYQERVEIEQQLAKEVQACESDVESCKEETAAAKGRLGEAHKKLAAFVRGGVQDPLVIKPGEKVIGADGHRTAYEQGYAAFNPKLADAVNPYPKDPQSADWYRGYGDAQRAAGVDPALPMWTRRNLMTYPCAEIDEALKPVHLLDRVLEEGQKAEMRRGEMYPVKGHTVAAFERDYLVIEDSGGDLPSHYLTLPLYSRDDWQSLHEKEFGRCVDGVDQTDEARTQRQLGGEFCGRAVKLGKKKFYIGPMKDGLVITSAEADAAEIEKDDAEDGKDD